jgi:preprotein translocase SecE subunit
MNALVTYLRNVRGELAHVAWPTPRTAIGHTLVVVLIAVIVALLVGGLDYLFTTAVSSVVGG